MPKRKNLNGLPHNLVKSYFGTLRYSGKDNLAGYMADWIFNAAERLGVDTVILDITNQTIDPKELELLPLSYHLKDLQAIIRKELATNGFCS